MKSFRSYYFFHQPKFHRFFIRFSLPFFIEIALCLRINARLKRSYHFLQKLAEPIGQWQFFADNFLVACAQMCTAYPKAHTAAGWMLVCCSGLQPLFITLVNAGLPLLLRAGGQSSRSEKAIGRKNVESRLHADNKKGGCVGWSKGCVVTIYTLQSVRGKYRKKIVVVTSYEARKRGKENREWCIM